MGTVPGALGWGQLKPASGWLVSRVAAKGSGRRSPRSLARSTSIPYRMNRTWFFMPVTIPLLSRANAAALQSARCVPPSFRAAARLPMSRSVPLLSAGTAGSSRMVNSSPKTPIHAEPLHTDSHVVNACLGSASRPEFCARRSDDTDARSEARRCFGRSDRS